MSGELTFWLGDDVRTVGAGTFVFGPRQVEHRFRVESEEAHFLLLLTPAGFEDFTRTCGWPAATRTMPPADLPGARSPPCRDAARATASTSSPSPITESHTTTTRSHAMITTYKAAPDIDVLTSNFPVPGLGLIPINAFVLHGASRFWSIREPWWRATSSWPRCDR